MAKTSAAPTEFDPDQLVVEQEDDMPARTRDGKYDLESGLGVMLSGALIDSYNGGSVNSAGRTVGVPMKVVVPGGDPLRAVISILRLAADAAEIGVRIVVRTREGDVLKHVVKNKVTVEDSLLRAQRGEIPGEFRVSFAAQDRRVRNGAAVEDSDEEGSEEE